VGTKFVVEYTSLAGSETAVSLVALETEIDLADVDSGRLVPSEHLKDEQGETDFLGQVN
jgi:hypothetical protein